MVITRKKDFFVFLNEIFENEPFSNRNSFSSIIMAGFCWVDTKEGGNFWERIYSDLKGKNKINIYRWN